MTTVALKSKKTNVCSDCFLIFLKYFTACMSHPAATSTLGFCKVCMYLFILNFVSHVCLPQFG
jgi:hypothetical protein